MGTFRPMMLRAKFLYFTTLATFLLPALALAQGSRLPGSLESGLILRQLDGVKRVLLVAAHPDDEDTGLITMLARGQGVETAYFSFTRGEGGQNVIGTELGEELGIIRSGELLAARAIDGGIQYFGRAFDFGYSKSADETFQEWPKNTILADLVWAIRSFRPHVLVTMWEGTSRDGHGQHQVAGALAREAYEISGDPEQFPEQIVSGLQPWSPLKIYRRTFFDRELATLEMSTGYLDPLLGKSYHQVAMESRSQHLSQDFGTAIPPGPRSTYLALIESRVDTSVSDPIFSGIDTTLTTLVAPLGNEALEHVLDYRNAISKAKTQLSPLDPSQSLPALSQAAEHLEQLRESVLPTWFRGYQSQVLELTRELNRKHELLGRAILAAAGVRIEVRARDDILVPGQKVLVEARVWSGAGAEVHLSPPKIDVPDGWIVERIGADIDVGPDYAGPFDRFLQREEPVADPYSDTFLPAGQMNLWRYMLTVPDDAVYTTPYFLDTTRTGSIYRESATPILRGQPFRPPLLISSVAATVSANGSSTQVNVDDPVRYRGVVGSVGEFWNPIIIAPRLSVTPIRKSVIWSTVDQKPREISYRLTNRDPRGISGSIDLGLPPGWRTTPIFHDFDLSTDGSETTLTFMVHPDSLAVEGEFFIPSFVRTNSETDEGIQAKIITYPHIEPRLVTSESKIRIRRFPIQVADRTIGYVMGSGDNGADAIRQLGLEVELLEPSDWKPDRLDHFDTIVLGVRAYEVRQDLVAANPLLLAWVERGGTLVVQYNRYEFNRGKFAPYPLAIDRPAPRVTDEKSRVTIRDSTSVVFQVPNRIRLSDFEGWVQERGLYFPSEWDQRYQALLEMADPGESPLHGSLLIAPHGKGIYVHTSLSFFRQLPAGVPGAYRLFANLISLDSSRWQKSSSSESRE